jgi:flagellar basal-body rod protein FlgC
MNSFIALDISASALEAQRQRMNVIASNMANVNSTRTEEGGPYRRRDVVFSQAMVGEDSVPVYGVKVADIVRDTLPFKTVHDPGHPDADKEGNVAMPNVNVLEETVNMMMSFRAYEASVSTFNITKSMIMKTLELGRT